MRAALQMKGSQHGDGGDVGPRGVAAAVPVELGGADEGQHADDDIGPADDLAAESRQIQPENEDGVAEQVQQRTPVEPGG